MICDEKAEVLVLAELTEELRQRDAELQETHARLAAIVESSDDAIIGKSLDGTITSWNRGAERIFGYGAAEMIGKPLALLIPPGRADELLQIMHIIRQGQSVEHYETIRRRKNGQEILISLTVSPIRNAAGTIIGASKIARDITDRKRADEKFRRVVESAPNAMVMAGADGRIVLVNAQTEKLFGYQRDELMGQPVEVLVPERFRNRHADYRAGFCAHPETRAMGVGRDLYGRRKDGSEFPVEIGLNPIKTEEGFMVLSAIVDITQRKSAEAEAVRLTEDLKAQRLTALNLAAVADEARKRLECVEHDLRKLNAELERRVLERTAELETANKELEAFSYSVSHDLRAPLRAIDGFSRIVLKEFAPTMTTEAQEYIQDIRANTQKMGHLVDDLLAFSRLSRQPVKRESVRTAKLVSQCLEELRGEQKWRGVEIHIGELPECLGDAALLKQVWTNLLANAFKYTSRRAAAIIEIGSYQDNGTGEQVYFVKDNGVGFDMDYAQKLFGVFQRLHRAEDYEGTGVGLAIVQRIVNRHGGRVWADAQLDKGASFFFTLAHGGSVHE
jgi:PAS domain S-box-containing protein